jgi:hypothetical protein
LPVAENKVAAAPATPTASPKAPSKTSGSSDGIFDKNTLIKQSWSDVTLAAEDKSRGNAIQSAKKSQAHSYFSAYCTVDEVVKTMTAFDPTIKVDTLIVRAASKAFAKVFKIPSVDVAKVN